ncbi:MAG TPA: hypothetical protein PLW50_00775 [Smithellaceae bacterium]|nr:hypothetical protein [Smithellaceae bacterium]
MSEVKQDPNKKKEIEQIWVAIRKDEVVEILKSIEALKRKLLKVLQI